VKGPLGGRGFFFFFFFFFLHVIYFGQKKERKKISHSIFEYFTKITHTHTFSIRGLTIFFFLKKILVLTFLFFFLVERLKMKE